MVCSFVMSWPGSPLIGRQWSGPASPPGAAMRSRERKCSQPSVRPASSGLGQAGVDEVDARATFDGALTMTRACRDDDLVATAHSRNPALARWSWPLAAPGGGGDGDGDEAVERDVPEPSEGSHAPDRVPCRGPDTPDECLRPSGRLVQPRGGPSGAARRLGARSAAIGRAHPRNVPRAQQLEDGSTQPVAERLEHIV